MKGKRPSRSCNVPSYAEPHPLHTLVVDVGNVHAKVNFLRPGPSLDALAVLLRQPPGMLLSMAVHRFAPALVFP